LAIGRVRRFYWLCKILELADIVDFH